MRWWQAHLLMIALGATGGGFHILPIFFEESLGSPSSLVSHVSLSGTIGVLATAFYVWTRCNGVIRSTVAGTLIGLGYFAASLYWLGESVVPEGTYYSLRAFLTALGGWTLLFPWWGLAFGLASALRLLLRAPSLSAQSAVIFTIMFSLCDLLLGDFVFRIPLAPIGTTLLDTIWQGALAGCGIHGASALLILIASMTTVGLHGKGSGIAGAIAALGVMTIFTVFGPRHAPTTPLSTDGRSVYLAQPMSPTAARLALDGTPDPEGVIIDNILLSIEEAGDADLIVLPETAIPYDLAAEPEIIQRLVAPLDRNQTLLVGFRRIVATTDDLGGFEVSSYNTVYALSSTGNIVYQYDKAHLVPFGEYMPQIFHDLGFDLIAGSPTSLEAGPSLDVAELPGFASFSLLTCYEALLSGPVSRETTGAQWMLNMSSEGLFGQTIGPRLLLRYSRIRAVESGRPVLRATATGFTSTINAHGEVIAVLDLNVRGGIETDVPAPTLTLFRLLGYVPLYATLSIGLIGAGAISRRAKPASGLSFPRTS